MGLPERYPLGRERVRERGHGPSSTRLRSRGPPVVRVVLTAKEVEPLFRDVDRRAGGFESLLDDLKREGKPDGETVVLLARPHQVERLVQYVQAYGQGGAQNRMRPIYAQLRRLGPAFVPKLSPRWGNNPSISTIGYGAGNPPESRGRVR